MIDAQNISREKLGFSGKRVTRLAPSPTGALHLGNMRTFLINWVLARKQNWHIVLRIEDLDSPRIKPWAVQQSVDDLSWLGMDWDEGPYDQLSDLSVYEEAIAALLDSGALYPCSCSRKEIQQLQSAPQDGSHELRYPGICRHIDHEALLKDLTKESALRFIVPDEAIKFVDQIAGPQCINLYQTVGDFVLQSKNGLPTYQLAVVIDDIRHNVTDIVRGDDLLNSAARQILIYDKLENSGLVAFPLPRPNYWHLPLVLGPDGRRLAKRHGDSKISTYRELGVSAERIIGLMAFWCGFIDRKQPMSLAEFMDIFDLKLIPKSSVIMREDDHQWLISKISV